MEDRGILTGEEVMGSRSRSGGLILVGSHTQKTTAQLEALKEVPGIRLIEFDSDKVTDDAAMEEEINSVVKQEEAYIRQGMTVAVYTKRRLMSVKGDTPEQALERSVRISAAVQQLAGR